MAEAPAASNANEGPAPAVAPVAGAAALVEESAEKPATTDKDVNPVADAKFVPTKDAVEVEAAVEAAQASVAPAVPDPTGANGNPNDAEEAAAPTETETVVAGGASVEKEDTPAATETKRDAPIEEPASEVAKDKDAGLSTEAVAPATEAVEPAAPAVTETPLAEVAITTNGTSTSGRGTKRKRRAEESEGNSPAKIGDGPDKPMNSIVKKTKVGETVGEIIRDSPVKSGTHNRRDDEKDDALNDKVAPKRAKNGANGVKLGKSSRREKKAPAPVGRTERKTRSQGPI